MFLGGGLGGLGFLGFRVFVFGFLGLSGTALSDSCIRRQKKGPLEVTLNLIPLYNPLIYRT